MTWRNHVNLRWNIIINISVSIFEHALKLCVPYQYVCVLYSRGSQPFVTKAPNIPYHVAPLPISPGWEPLLYSIWLDRTRGSAHVLYECTYCTYHWTARVSGVYMSAHVSCTHHGRGGCGLVHLVLCCFNLGLQVCRRMEIFAFVPWAAALDVVHTHSDGVLAGVYHGAVSRVSKSAVCLAARAITTLVLATHLTHTLPYVKTDMRMVSIWSGTRNVHTCTDKHAYKFYTNTHTHTQLNKW